MKVPRFNVYTKKDRKYLGKRSIHSRTDKSVKHGEGHIKYFIIWNGKEIFFKPVVGGERKVYV